MGRKSRAKRTATVRPALQPSSSDGRPQEHNKAVEGSKKLTVSSIVYPIVVTILVGIIAVVATRWLTEIGDHEKTRGELRGERESKGKLTAERDQLNKELVAIKKENSELKLLHPILEFYGPGAKLVTNYDLRKEAGSFITFGQCPDVPCFRVTLVGVQEHAGIPVAMLRLSEVWAGPEPQSINGFDAPLALKRGCSRTFKTKLWDITFAIEDDRATYLRAGIGLSPATHPVEGFISTSRGEGC